MLNYDKGLSSVPWINWHLCHSRKCSTADHWKGGAVLTRGCDPWDRLPVTITGVPPSPIQYRKPSDQCLQTPSSPCKTNYLSILYCQVASMLFMQAAISAIVNKKVGEVPTKEEQKQKVRGGVSEKLSLQQAGGTKEYRAECVTEQTVHWDFFHHMRIQHGLFLWVSHELSPSEVPEYSVLQHRFPRSVMWLGLYITSARTIKLLWIFMTGLKTSFSVPQVSQNGCNQNSESLPLCR